MVGVWVHDFDDRSVEDRWLEANTSWEGAAILGDGVPCENQLISEAQNLKWATTATFTARRLPEGRAREQVQG